MFELFRSQSRSAAGAIVYVTIGTLMVIWSGLWYCYFIVPVHNPPAWQSYACVSTILSGAAIAAIGMLFGIIGRGAKDADNTVGVATSNPVMPTVQSPGFATRIGPPHIIDAPVLADAPLIARRSESVVP